MTLRKTLIIVGIVFVGLGILGFNAYLRVTKNLTKVDENQYAPAGCPLHDYAVLLTDVYRPLGLHLAVGVQDNSVSGYIARPQFDLDAKKYMLGPSRPVDLYQRYLIAKEAGAHISTYVWSFPTAFQATSEYDRQVGQYDKANLGRQMADRKTTFPGVTIPHQAFHYLSGGQGTDREWTVLARDSNLLFIIYVNLPTGKTRPDFEAALQAWSERIDKIQPAAGETLACRVEGRIRSSSVTSQRLAIQ